MNNITAMARTERIVSIMAALAIVVAVLSTGTALDARADDSGDAAKALPARIFFRNPDIGEAKLSPSGRWLAITTAKKTGRVFLAVVDLGEQKAPPKVVAAYSDVDVHSFEWVNDERLVFNTIDLASTAGDQEFGPGLYSVKRDGSEVRMLIRPRFIFLAEASRMLTQPLEPNHELLEVLRDGSDDVIVGEYRFAGVRDLESITPMRLNTATGRATALSAGAPPYVLGWLFDRTGRPRVAVTHRSGRSEVFTRSANDAPWKSIARLASMRSGFIPLAVDGDDKFYAEVTSPAGMGVLKRFDFASGTAEADAIVSAPGFDLDATAVIDPESSRVVGVRYDTDAEATAWLDPAYKTLQAMVDTRFAGHVNRMICRRCTSDGVLMVYSYSDQDPGSYWLYRVASKSWEEIGKRRGDVDPAQMAQVDFFRARARDGEDLPVWVTTPRGKSAKPRAAVVLVHGGPWVRGGSWAWNPDAQFLASRGYVVIEPEFRGSHGYGKAHFVKGFKQWGLTMQDDVADAVAWAATKGMIDPKRVCIAGASYGGYATLMGLVRQPDTYKCGVAWVAVTDPRLLFADSWVSDTSQEGRKFSLPVMLGDPDKDAALLKDAAPVEHAKEIRAPLLMAFGEIDSRVPLEHGKRMRDAMRSAGLKPEFVIYDGEGHGWLKVDNRVDFWNRVDRFLAQQLQ